MLNLDKKNTDNNISRVRRMLAGNDLENGPEPPSTGETRVMETESESKSIEAESKSLENDLLNSKTDSTATADKDNREDPTSTELLDSDDDPNPPKETEQSSVAEADTKETFKAPIPLRSSTPRGKRHNNN